MDGVHDMGGMHGFGRIERQDDKPAFHEVWEGRVMGISQATPVPIAGGMRSKIEGLDPALYLSSSYYERWLHARIQGLIEAGAITAEELEAKVAYYRANPDAALPEPPDETESARREQPRSKSTGDSPALSSPAFSVDDRVRVRNMHPAGHSRLPRYIRGKVGKVVRVYRHQRVQDHEPIGDHEGPQPVYAVEFDGDEVWGTFAEPNSRVLLDMWESYLVAVQ